ncbi:MAG: hypothetical protein ACK5LN_09325 [Propioniciclava sp.]
MLDDNGHFVRSILDDPAYRAAGIQVSVSTTQADTVLTTSVGRTG